MRRTIALLALLIASPALADDPVTPWRRPATIQRREASQAAREKAAEEQRLQAAADRARAVAYHRFVTLGVLPADPVEAQNVLRMHDLRMRQAEMQAKAQAAQPNGRWVVGFDPRTGRRFSYFLANEESAQARTEADRAFGSMQQSRNYTGSVTPNGVGGFNVDIQSNPQ